MSPRRSRPSTKNATTTASRFLIRKRHADGDAGLRFPDVSVRSRPRPVAALLPPPLVPPLPAAALSPRPPIHPLLAFYPLRPPAESPTIGPLTDRTVAVVRRPLPGAARVPCLAAGLGSA